MSIVEALVAGGILAIVIGAPGGPMSAAFSWSDPAVFAQEAALPSGPGGASPELREAAANERRRAVPLSSVVRFQRVVDFSIDDAGEPRVVWSTPIEYRVEEHALVRVQDGEKCVVAPDVAVFRGELTDAGTLAFTVVVPERASSTGRLTLQAVRSEVDTRD